MKSSLLLTAVSVGFSLATLPNNYQQVLTDLAIITAQTKLVTAYQAEFQPNNLTLALAVLDASIQLETYIIQATNDATISEPFGDVGSAAISQATIKQTKPIGKSLSTIIAKKPEFEEGVAGINLSGSVIATLQTLQTDTNNLGNAIVAKLTPEYAAAAPAILDQINTDFDNAIEAYGGTPLPS